MPALASSRGRQGRVELRRAEMEAEHLVQAWLCWNVGRGECWHGSALGGLTDQSEWACQSRQPSRQPLQTQTSAPTQLFAGSSGQNLFCRPVGGAQGR